MKSPQLEDGYVQIANELFEAITAADFSKREYKIILTVIRKTYGFRKKTDDMTMTQIAAATGLQLPHVSATVRNLGERNVLLIQSGRYGKVIGLSKNYRNWKMRHDHPVMTKTVSDRNSHVTETVITGDQNSHLRLPKRSTQKKLPKDTTKRKETKPVPTWLNIEAWTEFEQHRKDIRKPLTDTAREKNLDVLEPLDHQAQKQSIDETIRNRWTGLFSPKGKPNEETKRNLSAPERVRAAATRRAGK